MIHMKCPCMIHEKSMHDSWKVHARFMRNPSMIQEESMHDSYEISMHDS